MLNDIFMNDMIQVLIYSNYSIQDCFQRNKKDQNLFEMSTKNDVFFAAGCWERDIIFGGYLKQILALLLSEL